MLELDLSSFKSNFAACVDGYEPLKKLRDMNKIKKFVFGKSMELSLEVDTARNMIKLYISRIDLGSDILGMAAMGAKQTIYKKALAAPTVTHGLVDKAANAVKNVIVPTDVTVSGGLDVEFENSAEDLLGFWQLKTSSFKASKEDDDDE